MASLYISHKLTLANKGMYQGYVCMRSYIQDNSDSTQHSPETLVPCEVHEVKYVFPPDQVSSQHYGR